MREATLGLFIIILAVVAIIWWPFAVIWSVNTLFNTGIPMNFRTWAATALLVALLRFNLDSTKKPKG